MSAGGAGARPRSAGSANPIRTRKDWEAARDAAARDPGGFHGDIARRELYWLEPKSGAWVKRVDGAAPWVGFDAATGARRAGADLGLAADWTPWARAFDDSEAPFYRWFAGGLTNACFNEVDVHVLAGRGRQVAFHFEGDRWDPAAEGGRGGPVVGKAITRQELMWQVAKHAVVLADLGLGRGDRIALNMPNVMEQIYFTEAAKRLGIIYTPVFGGFSAKTLSDRIHDAGAKVVITTDGAYRNAQVVGFKEPYTDRALDDYVPLGAALEIVSLELRAFAAASAAAARVQGRAATDAKIGADDVAAIDAVVAESLAGEITVERADVMRGVGRALEARAGWDAATKTRLRTAIAEALAKPVARVEKVVVVRNTGLADLAWVPRRDVWAHELGEAATAKLLANARAAGVAVAAEAEALALDAAAFTKAVWATTKPLPVDAEFPLFIIYTSGSTGKPKGVVHTHGGYVAGLAHTMRVSFDVPPLDQPSGAANDHVIYVVADPGWITGQSYLISAALTTGTTSVVTEGSPLFPSSGRFASIIERYRVTLFKAGSTFLKAVASDPQNVEDVKLYDRSTLRCATFCAEPVSPSIQKFGMELLTPQYINSYWATEHGGIVLTHFYGNDDFALAPDAHTFPLPWVFADVWTPAASFEVDGRARHEHRRAGLEEKGELVITRPYPYLARTVWGDGARVGAPGWRGDLKRFTEIYFDRWSEAGSEGRRITWAYTQGDFACRYEDGSMTLHGRSDDVINTSGHRLGTEEIEGAILKDKQQNPKSAVGNAIVVGAPHREKGTVPLAFILTAGGRPLSLDDERRLTALVREEKGAVAAPAGYICVSQFPETRSGKYMRRFLKNLLEGEPLGDTTTLRNPEALDEIGRAIRRWQARAALEDDQQLLTLYATLRLEVHEVRPGDAIAVLTISKPPVNALDERALDELNTVVEHLARREDIKAVVLTGAGTQSFVAGADVRQLLEEMHTAEDVLPLCHKAAQVTRKLESMGKPVVAAVNGLALGGGNEFQMAAHYRVAETTARFGQPEINLHLLPGYGGTQRLPRLLEGARGGIEGLVKAIELILGGRSLDAEDALRVGLVEEIAIETDALTRATALARELILEGKGPLLDAHANRLEANARWAKPAVYPAAELEAHPEVRRLVAQARSAGRELPAGWALDAIRFGYEHGLAEGLEHEGRLFAEAVVHPQAGRIGLRAFFDRRSAPLPTRRREELERARSHEADALDAGRLLPIGAPFFPGVTPLPAYQYALLAEKDPATGIPRHGDPARAEQKRIIPVPAPGASEALLYMLTSEINFNDIWAITGVPVSPFDSHDEDWHVTGSGGLALVARVGEEVKREGRIKVGDLVAVFSGQSQLLSPVAGKDPMFADQHIQGYETPDGSHQQFMIAQGPQLFPKPSDLTLEAGGSYILNLGTVYRALYTTLGIGADSAGKTMFVEGAATGTGLEALKAATRSRVRVTGLVSSEARQRDVLAHGARGAIDRKDPRFAAAFTTVPDDPGAWAVWEAAGAPLVEDFRRQNDGRLADYVVSHAGETSFPRGFQLLAEGGVLTFFGASSGYRFTFMGKPGAVAPEAVMRRAGLGAAESVLVFYGSGGPESGALDPVGLECIEAARELGARIVVCARTDAERDFVKSMGFGEAVRGVFSVQELQRREGDAFSWPRTMPLLPDPRKETAAFKEAVRWYQEQVFKPFASQVGAFLRGAGNPRGYPDLVVERAGQDTLALSSMLVKPYTGRVVFCEDMAARRYTFYAPQVWMRQRRIYLPTANIWGTHLSNAYEVQRMNELVDAGLLQVGDPLVVPFDDGPGAHQEMWENRHRASNYVLNHALPEMGLKTKDELYQAWSKRGR
jgi:acrylyl-CoA reductase (NADPH)/3-hydroxypropionyl-CoA dehydratase/3-hydroxypropionyl-CoA synthetase